MESSEIRLLAHHGQAQTSGRFPYEQRPAVGDQQPAEVSALVLEHVLPDVRDFAVCNCMLIFSPMLTIAEEACIRLRGLCPQVSGISESQLANLKRQWAESHSALADRAMKDREEIERLTQLLYDQQKSSLRQLRARAEMSGISAPAAHPPVQGERLAFGGEASCQSVPPYPSQGLQAASQAHQPGYELPAK